MTHPSSLAYKKEKKDAPFTCLVSAPDETAGNVINGH
jgi:hypothetical protein